MPSSEAVPLTLVTIASDLQINICTFLHPSDILSLRKTCQAFLIITKERIIWIDALRRLCVDNALFLASFPVIDMSNIEIERATMAPSRWARLCVAWSKQYPDGFRPKLNPIAIRTMWGALDETHGSMMDAQTYLVPGGRYLVANSRRGMSFWDLGYTSKTNCKLVASVGWDNTYTCLVNATSDGMGMIIVAICRNKHCSVYEIYPLESETPHLTRIAHLDFPYPGDPLVLLMPKQSGLLVWDYRLNHSMSFLVDFDVEDPDYKLKAIATETMIIVLCEEAIFVWGIPPLSPQSVEFFGHDPTPIPLLRRVPFPDNILLKSKPVKWVMMSRWYSGSSPSSLYFDTLCRDLRLYGFEIVIKSDFGIDVSLRVINSTRQLSSDDFNTLKYRTCGGNRICENLLVSVTDSLHCPIYFRPISSHPNVISARGRKVPNMSVFLATSAREPSLCSASGRFVYHEPSNQNIVVLEFI